MDWPEVERVGCEVRVLTVARRNQDFQTIRSEGVRKQFPQAPQLAPGTLLYALHAADGTPIMLTDSREAAIANAWSQELETVSVH